MHRSLCFALSVLAWAASAQEPYRKPPKPILDVLNAPVTPAAVLSPTKDYLLLAEPLRYPPIAELARPMLRLAGLRIDPGNNGPHGAGGYVSLSLLRVADGTERKAPLPPGAKIGSIEWSPDGRRFAFTNARNNGIELWIGEPATGQARRIEGVHLNAAYGDPVRWMPDSRSLLVQLVPAARGKAPEQDTAPAGPNLQESSGNQAAVWTFQDLLKSPRDEALFQYYAASQLALVEVAGGKRQNIGSPAVFQMAAPSPDGLYLLVARLHRPFSYLYTHQFFPKDVEVWDRLGKVVHTLAKLPLADTVPVDGVPAGPRAYAWRPNEPNTLVWVEALDGGDPKTKVPHRDRVLMQRAPFTGAPAEIAKVQHRFDRLAWGAKNGLALLTDYDRERRWSRTVVINADNPSAAVRELWSLDSRDRYNDPGDPLMRTLPNGQKVLAQDGDWLFLSGQGATPAGDRPFLRRFHLADGRTQELFRCDDASYESVLGLLTDDGAQALTRRESPKDPPNYFARTLAAAGAARALTRYPDPAPQLRGITKRLVTYKRADGVQLSFTLYLPPGYKQGVRLPTVVWAYPLEYSDPATAGQVAGSTQRFTTVTSASHLFFLLDGYAVLDGATMPVVGDFKTANNTYVEQIVASAQAAIDKAVELGVTDPQRVGVGGHSYGAFMTANLLAYSDLFRAGIARSGAYNRTLTPFGFQSERRTFWEAPEIYFAMSPFMHAHKVKEPVLLIHGEADNNSGTFPIQSDRMYQALRGNGGTVRLVMLPFESHGYAARESVEHTLYEMISWFNRYVKDAPPRSAAVE